MIETHKRLQYLGHISQFILDEEIIASVWVHNKSGITSVTDFDELYEQLFDDLDFDEFEKELVSELEIDPDSRTKIMQFITSIREVDKAIQADQSLGDPANLLSSVPWAKFRVACANVLRTSAVSQALAKDLV